MQYKCPGSDANQETLLKTWLYYKHISECSASSSLWIIYSNLLCGIQLIETKSAYLFKLDSFMSGHTYTNFTSNWKNNRRRLRSSIAIRPNLGENTKCSNNHSTRSLPLRTSFDGALIMRSVFPFFHTHTNRMKWALNEWFLEGRVCTNQLTDQTRNNYELPSVPSRPSVVGLRLDLKNSRGLVDSMRLIISFSFPL